MIDRGGRVAYVDVGSRGSLVAEKYGVEAIDMELNVTHLAYTLRRLAGLGYDAVFIRGLDASGNAFGRETFVQAIRYTTRASRMGPAVVASLRRLYGMDILFDVVIRTGEDFVESVCSPIGKHRIPKAECKH